MALGASSILVYANRHLVGDVDGVTPATLTFLDLSRFPI